MQNPVEPCECGHAVPCSHCPDVVERHCCEHKKPLISPDFCEECLDADDYLGGDI